MAFTGREIPLEREALFDVVSDPRTYPAWLVGTVEVSDVDPGWPRPGTRFHHRVGRGRLTIADWTSVLAVRPGRLLRLEVRASPLIHALVTFRFADDDDATVVTFEEEPAARFVGNLVRPVLDPLTHVRNHASLRRLGDYVIRTRVDPSASERTDGSDPLGGL